METRSKIDLKRHGAYVYAEDVSTDILCMAIKVDDEPTILWIPVWTSCISYTLPPKQISTDMTFEYTISKATEIHAHNAQFERIMWHHVMHKKYGFPDIPFNKWRCTAAKAAYYALPRSLDMASQALNLDQRKDQDGYRIMLKMCKPRKPKKAEREANPDWENTTYWHEDPEEFQKLCTYCIQDVETEYAIDKALPKVQDKEIKIWQLDQKINDRGIAVDIEGINSIINKIKKRENNLLRDIEQITNGYINSVRQIAKTLSWLKTNGVMLPDLTKATVSEVLETDIPKKCKKLLEIRQSLGKSSVSKFDAMKRWACKDGRVRGSMLYHGATTGRWAGRGIQPQNYPRESFNTKEIEQLLALDNEMIDMIHDCTIQAASKCLRGMLMADKDNQIICADFKAIEGRVLAWVAGEKYILQNYRENKDPYKVFAAQIHKISYNQVTDRQRFDGKTGELACGYQGWVGAVKQFAPNMPEEKAKEIVLMWRENRPLTVRFWKGVENAAIMAVKTGKTYNFRNIKYGIRGSFLHCLLPSGRLLAYYEPRVEITETPYGQKREVIAFTGMNSETNQWCKQNTYGGKLTENIVQAISRDLLAEALLRLEKNKYETILHIHDEILVETEIADYSIKNFEALISKIPEWAKGLPLDAKGWIGKRYRK